MPREFRLQRIADLIRETLANTILQDDLAVDIKDTIIHKVIVSKDLSLAKVYVSFILAQDPKPSILALNKAAKTLRHKLAKQCTLRITPELKFFHDDSSVKSQKLIELINQVTQGQE